MQLIRRLIAACALTGAAMSAGADTPELPSSVLAYEQAVMSVGRDAAADRPASLRAAALAEAVEAGGRGAAYLYGQIALLDGILAAGTGRMADAEHSFEQARSFGEEAVEREPTSEHYRVVADSYMQLLRIKPMPYRIANAGRARRAADDAVRLDRRNPRALIAAASYYGSTPAIAGGDLPRAGDYLDRALPLTAGSKTLRFVCVMWQAIIADARSDTAGARDWLRQARALFPESAWYLDTRQEILGE